MLVQDSPAFSLIHLTRFGNHLCISSASSTLLELLDPVLRLSGSAPLVLALRSAIGKTVISFGGHSSGL